MAKTNRPRSSRSASTTCKRHLRPEICLGATRAPEAYKSPASRSTLQRPPEPARARPRFARAHVGIASSDPYRDPVRNRCSSRRQRLDDHDAGSSGADRRNANAAECAAKLGVQTARAPHRRSLVGCGATTARRRIPGKRPVGETTAIDLPGTTSRRGATAQTDAARRRASQGGGAASPPRSTHLAAALGPNQRLRFRHLHTLFFRQCQRRCSTAWKSDQPDHAPRRPLWDGYVPSYCRQ